MLKLCILWYKYQIWKEFKIILQSNLDIGSPQIWPLVTFAAIFVFKIPHFCIYFPKELFKLLNVGITCTVKVRLTPWFLFEVRSIPELWLVLQTTIRNNSQPTHLVNIGCKVFLMLNCSSLHHFNTQNSGKHTFHVVCYYTNLISFLLPCNYTW